MNKVFFISLCLFVTCLDVQGAFAKPCRAGYRVHLETPLNQQKVPQNTRFIVRVYRGCGSVKSPEAFRFRMTDGSGKTIPMTRKQLPSNALCRPMRYCQRHQFVPKRRYFGLLRFASGRRVGKGMRWKRLAAVEMTPVYDREPPQFAGIRAGSSQVIKGSCLTNPCIAHACWKIKRQIVFSRASDRGSTHDSLLYILEKKVGSRWISLIAFRPHIMKDKKVGFSWETTEGWGQRETYRVKVRDVVGAETIGTKVLSILSPPKPKQVLSRRR